MGSEQTATKQSRATTGFHWKFYLLNAAALFLICCSSREMVSYVLQGPHEYSLPSLNGPAWYKGVIEGVGPILFGTRIDAVTVSQREG